MSHNPLANTFTLFFLFFFFFFYTKLPILVYIYRTLSMHTTSDSCEWYTITMPCKSNYYFFFNCSCSRVNENDLCTCILYLFVIESALSTDQIKDLYFSVSKTFSIRNKFSTLVAPLHCVFILCLWYFVHIIANVCHGDMVQQ